MKEVKPTRADYVRIFEAECANSYPVIDEFERACGFAIDRDKLEEAARTMACPYKVNPPNWQHGRVLYALIRRLAVAGIEGNFLDIGTAKGFSAVVASWAIDDAGLEGRSLHSVDIIEPLDRVRRNSVLELDGYKTIPEFAGRYMSPRVKARFVGGGSQQLLAELLASGERLAFAFVDGKHQTEDVKREAAAIAKMQSRGGIIMFDDVQIAPVAVAVRAVQGYKIEMLALGSQRCYAIATKQ